MKRANYALPKVSGQGLHIHFGLSVALVSSRDPQIVVPEISAYP